MANKAQTSPADVKSEIETLRADFASLAAEVNNLVKAQTEAAKEGAAERVVELKSAGQRELEKVGAAATKSAEDAEQFVKANPAGSVAGAAAIGFALGALLARK